MDTTQLQKFVEEHDAQISINVQFDIVSSSMLQSAIEQQGFHSWLDGHMVMLAVMLSADGRALFSARPGMSHTDGLSRITLLMHAPCVSPADDAFGKMISCARDLAAQLAGAVVDDAGAPLTDSALAEIAGQITKFHADMEAAGIPAGSLQALELFGESR